MGMNRCEKWFVWVIAIALTASIWACTQPEEVAREYEVKYEDEKELLYGRIKELHEIELTEGGEELVFRYDEAGRLIGYWDAKGQVREEYVYDSLGRRVGWSGYRKESLDGTRLYEYDERGGLIRTLEYNYYPSQQIDTMVTHYEYSPEGRLIRDSARTEAVYTYNDAGLLETIRTSHRGCPEGELTELRYNGKAQVVELLYKDEHEGGVSRHELIEYNERGLVARKEVRLGKESYYLDRYEYDYDSKGNWIERRCYDENTKQGSEPSEVVKRRIVYY